MERPSIVHILDHYFANEELTKNRFRAFGTTRSTKYYDELLSARTICVKRDPLNLQMSFLNCGEQVCALNILEDGYRIAERKQEKQRIYKLANPHISEFSEVITVL